MQYTFQTCLIIIFFFFRNAPTVRIEQAWASTALRSLAAKSTFNGIWIYWEHWTSASAIEPLYQSYIDRRLEFRVVACVLVRKNWLYDTLNEKQLQLQAIWHIHRQTVHVWVTFIATLSIHTVHNTIGSRNKNPYKRETITQKIDNVYWKWLAIDNTCLNSNIVVASFRFANRFQNSTLRTDRQIIIAYTEGVVR